MYFTTLFSAQKLAKKPQNKVKLFPFRKGDFFIWKYLNERSLGKDAITQKKSRPSILAEINGDKREGPLKSGRGNRGA